MERVLVVDDSRALQKALLRLFQSEAFTVDIAADGVSALERFRENRPSVVVLDLKLPGKPGEDVCREFKSSAPDVPIVVLSANSETEDKVTLLEMGADDYVTKPFSPKELLARVRRAMRPGAEVASPQSDAGARPDHAFHVLIFSDVHVNFTTRDALKAGRQVTLTSQEFRVLQYLAGASGNAVSREELLDQLWESDKFPTARTIDNHILRLRQKLEPDPANPRHFLTVHGTGYRFVANPDGAGATP